MQKISYKNFACNFIKIDNRMYICYNKNKMHYFTFGFGNGIVSDSRLRRRFGDLINEE